MLPNLTGLLYVDQSQKSFDRRVDAEVVDRVKLLPFGFSKAWIKRLSSLGFSHSHFSFNERIELQTAPNKDDRPSIIYCLDSILWVSLCGVV
jgi:hypothetical protein